ncbi:C2 domain [Phytophthora cactorum]|nr:C2 domain [Phytophthora cactorum]
MGQATSTTSAASSTPAAASEPVAENSVLDVELEIVSAKDIAAGDYFTAKAAVKGHVASSDAYALIEVGGQKVAWTRPIFSTLEPVWNEKFFFKNVKPDTICKLYLLDKDFEADDALGQTQFTAANTAGVETTFELPITREDKPAGTIVVKVKSHPTPAIGNGQLQQVGPVHYSVHSSYINGIITDTSTDEDKRESFAYTCSCTTSRPSWPRTMSGTTTTSPWARPTSLTCCMTAKTREACALHVRYHPTGWYFSETGAAFFKDILSKHMLHSGAQFNVKYAGEFHVEKGSPGEFKLFIDNNSGTYAPPKEELPQLKALLETNFPGISIEALDRASPELKEKRKEILDAWAA